MTTYFNPNEIAEVVCNHIKTILTDAHRIALFSPSSSFAELKMTAQELVALRERLTQSFHATLPGTFFLQYRCAEAITNYFVALNQSLNQTESAAPQPSATAFEQQPSQASPVNDTDIAIIGMSGRFPGAKNTSEFWTNLTQGKDSVGKNPLHQDLYHSALTNKTDLTHCPYGASIEDVDLFDPSFFGIAPIEGALIDPQERLFLQVAYEALQDAHLNPKEMSEAAREMGVYVGVIWQDYQLIALEETLKGNPVVVSSLLYSIANRVSYTFNFTGPSLAVDTACSSSLTALHLACQAILLGEVKSAIVGGVNLNLHPMKYAFLNNYDFLSSEGRCRSYGEGGDGYVPGEGIGALVIKSLKDAINDNDPIYAVIKGTAINHGGKTRGYTVPNPTLQSKVILAALKRAKVNPRDISYVEGHGTGTALGDPIEVRGLELAYSQFTTDTHYCALGSVKSNIGHLEAAAGIASLIKLTLQMNHKMLVPSLHSATLNQNVDFTNTPFYVQQTLSPWDAKGPLLGAVSSFGAGGSYAHVILESYPIARDLSPPEPPVHQEHYWVEQSRGVSVHPLLGGYSSTPDEEIMYRGILDLSVLAYLRDHKVYGQVIYPGAGYIEMLLAAGFYSLGEEGLHLSEVSIEAALRFDAGNPIETQVIMKPNDAGYEVGIYSGTKDSWQCHARGIVSLSENRALPALLDIATIKSRCAKRLTASNFYGQVEAIGISYGPQFQALTDIYVGQNEALGELILPSSAQGYLAHPSVLDGALQLLITSVTGAPFLPVGCDVIEFYAPFGEHLYAHWQETERTETGITSTITLCSETGVILATLTGMHYRKTSEQALRNMLAHEAQRDDWMYEWSWQEHALDASATLELEGEWLVFGEGAIPDALQGHIKQMHLISQDKHPKNKAEFLGLLQEQPYAGVIHASSPADKDIEQTYGTQSLLHLSQALVEHPTPLVIVTEDTLSEGAMLGFYKTINAEHPELALKFIELGQSWSKDTLIQILLDSSDEQLLRLIDERVYVPRLLTSSNAKRARQELTRPLDDAFRLSSTQKGLLENLTLAPLELKTTLAPDEVEVMVHAVGLNFRDVLDALGLYPGEPGPLGADGAGVITRIGSAVRSLKPGDAVLGMMSGALSLMAWVHQDNITQKPDTLSFADAAALPTVFLTVYYALTRCTTLKPGDTILIHAGAGGVGQAAIQIAKHFGARIITTAGGDAKRAFLEAQGIKHIFDSRSLSYGKDIKELTQGQGVDVVLNSLSGEGFIETSVGICAQGARFLEIGKRDIWSLEAMHNKRPDIDYHIIALDDISQSNPEIIQAMLQELMPLFAQGVLSPLPITCFPIEQAIHAFDYMRAARHIGKVVIELPPAKTLLDIIRKDATYLISGGLGGLGQTVARWLSTQGATKIVLTGRKPADEAIEALIQNLTNESTSIRYASLDIGDEAQVKALLGEIAQTDKPLKGIFHLAGILDDATLMEQDWAHFERVFGPKVSGSWNLHQHSKDLDLFVMFSSVASSLGNPGQSNYAAANGFMDALCAYRRAQGMPAHSLSWGPWAEVGMAKDLVSRHAKGGMIGIRPQEGMRLMEAALTSTQAHLTLVHMNWASYLKQRIDTPTWLSAFAQEQTHKESLVAQLELIAAPERPAKVKEYVVSVVRAVLGLSASHALDEDKGFFDMGLDSLMAIELKNQLQVGLGKAAILAATAVFDHSSVDKMARHIGELLHLEHLQHRPKAIELTPQMADEPIAIIGMSCRFPGGANDVTSYWNLLEEGRDGISDIPASRWDADAFYDANPDAPGKMSTKKGGFLDVDVSQFDATFFRISPKEAEYLDPQQRLLLEVSYEAILSSGLNPADLKESAAGVFVGICSHDYMDLLTATGNKSLINPYMATGNMASTASGRLSFAYGFQGPNFAIDTACSSSLVAIDEACKSLRTGDASLALAGGVNLMLSPDLTIDFSKAGMLAADGYCKTFDARADGYVRGEGCGIIVLKRLSDAQRDGNKILAVIKGSAVNQDGASSGLTVPNGEAQEALIRRALAKAKLDPSDIDYLEAHGTGTSLGDPIEVHAVGATYGQRDAAHPLRMGSVKTNIGHLEGAAGIAGVIKVILALQHELLPKHLHFTALNPHIEMNFPAEIPVQNTPWVRGVRVRRAAVSSFGFSGTNAHVILEEGPSLTHEEQDALVVHPPFQRQRYWSEAARVSVGRQLLSVHPLLGEYSSTPDNEIIYRGALHLGALPYLRDHQVYHHIIYPGAGYMEMLLAAGFYGLGEEGLHLSQVSIEAALSFDTANSIETQVIMKPNDTGYEVGIYSSTNEYWQCHARGMVSVSANRALLAPLDIAAIKSRCTGRITASDFYQQIEASGISYGPQFQALTEIHVGQDEALGELIFSSSAQGYLAHPSVLDGALQLLATSLSDAVFLPVGCDTIEFYAPLGEHLYAHWQKTETTESSREGNITLCSETGVILATLTGMHYRKTSEQALRNMLAHELGNDELLYEWVWQEEVLEPLQSNQAPGHWLLLSDGIALEPLLISKGATCFTLAKEEQPKSKDEFITLLKSQTFNGIIHASSTGFAEPLSAQDIQQAQRYGTQSLLHLTQALVALEERVKIPITLITTDTLSQSPINGFYKTLIAEHPELVIRCINTDDPVDFERLYQCLITPSDEALIRIKNHRCEVPRLVKANNIHIQESESMSDVPIRSDATYLITGGLGGLGLTVAKWLSEKGAGHLILTGRKALDDKTTEILKNLETEHTPITYEAMDVGDEHSVVDLMKTLEHSEKPLKGIFHLAGILDDATLMEQDWNHFERVFRPKVYGSFYLHQHSKNLELYIMFSSIASSLGSPGQSNYAAANAFMDALCEYRTQQGLPGLSLSWGPWAEVGMAKDLVARHAKGGMLGIKPREGMQALEKAIVLRQSHVTVMNINWANYLKSMIEAPRWFDAFALEKISQATLPAQLEKIPVSERLGHVKKQVTECVNSVLGLSVSQFVDDKKGFFNMGLDSLMAIELRNRLQAALGKTAILATTAVFDYATIEQMTNHLAELLKLESIQLKKTTQVMAPVRTDEPIAIIGMGCRYPGGANNPEEFWRVLETGVDGICEVPKDRFDVDEYYDSQYDVPGKMYTRKGGFLTVPVDLFDADFFGISPKEAQDMDPQQRVLLEVTWEALEHAGIAPEALEGSATGLYVGMMYSDYSQLIIESTGIEGMTAYYGSGNAFSAAVGRVSYCLGLQGPCLAIDTACSSSLVAINSACESLRLGQCQQAIAGGVSLMLAPGSFVSACQAHMLAPDGHCKTFDASADGYARAEGCGMIVLKRLSDAQRDGDTVYAIIKSSGVNQGGTTSGLTVPNGKAQEALLRQVSGEVGLKPDDIDYVEAHGTGTSLGDPIEVRAVGAAYGSRDPSRPLLLGSAKSNIGHTESAAGVAGVIKLILSLNHEMLPPNLNFNALNPNIDLNFPVKILTEKTPWPRSDRVRRAGVSSFGFSGVNAHLIIEEAPRLAPQGAEREERPLHVLTLSAKTEAALEELIKHYQAFLMITKATLPDICYTANTGRNHERYRMAVVAKDVTDLKLKLDSEEYVKGEALEQKDYDIPVASSSTEWGKVLDDLASAYTTGARVDWVEFDASYHRQKVSLPTYPFQRQRYWSEAAMLTMGKKMVSVHPLLGEHYTTPEAEIVYRGELHLGALSYLKDHQVYGYIIYPGAGYLEMMLASALNGLGEGEIHLSQVSIEAALSFDGRKSVETQIIMKSADAGYEIAIYSQAQDMSSEHDSWHCHARGVARVLVTKSSPAPLNIEMIKARCEKRLGQKEFYEHVNATGIDYGTHFQALKTLYIGASEALGELKITSNSKGYLAHPALLDGALQLVVVSLWEDKSSDLYLPVGCDTIEFYAPLGEHLYAHWEETETSESSIEGTITLCSETGAILATLTGMHYRRTNEQALRHMLTHETGIDELLYEWVWQEQVLEPFQSNQAQGHWLLLSDGIALEPLLIGKGATCHTLAEEEQPKSKDEFITLLKSQTFNGIIHASSTGFAEPLSAQDIQQAQRYGTQSLLHLTQALVALEERVKIPITLITTDTLSQSPINGFYKTLIAEHPELVIRCINTDDPVDFERLYQCLITPSDEALIRIKNHRCEVPRLVKANNIHIQESESMSDVPIRSDATYLITGGLGGLGLTVAKWLSEKGAGHLILTGRKALDDKTTEILKNLETEHTPITYEAMDVGDEHSVVDLMKTLEHSEKPLKGIFHLAGILDDATLMEQDWNHFERVFRPKVYGSFYLHQYAKDLDLFVLFSSVASSLGSPGQSNYAAANAFMDALCDYRARQGKPALSVSWGPWAEVGMAKDLVARHAKGGMLGIKPKEGMQALEKAIMSRQSHVTVMNMNWANYLKSMIEAPTWFEAFALQKTSKNMLSAQLEAVPTDQRMPLVKLYVTSVVSSVLGLSASQAIDEKKGFFDMGLDSLMAIELKNRLQQGLGKMIPLGSTVVFDYSNIELMVHYLGQLLNLEPIKVISRQEALEQEKIEKRKLIHERISALSESEAEKLIYNKLMNRSKKSER